MSQQATRRRWPLLGTTLLCAWLALLLFKLGCAPDLLGFPCTSQSHCAPSWRCVRPPDCPSCQGRCLLPGQAWEYATEPHGEPDQGPNEPTAELPEEPHADPSDASKPPEEPAAERPAPEPTIDAGPPCLPVHLDHILGSGWGPVNHTLAATPDGSKIVLAWHGSLLVYNASFERLFRLYHDKRSPKSTAISQDGAWLLTAHNDGSVLLWDLAKRSLAATWQSNEEITHIKLHPNGSTVAVAGKSGIVKVWDIKTRALTKTWSAHSQGAVDQMEFSPKGDLLVTSSEKEAAIKWWRYPDGSLHRTTKVPDATPIRLAFSPDSRKLAVAHAPSGIAIVDAADGSIASYVHAGPIQALLYHPDGTTLLIATDKAVEHVSPDPTTVQSIRSFASVTAVQSMALLKGGKLLTNSHVLRRWELSTGRLEATTPLARPLAQTYTGALALHPRKTQMAAFPDWGGQILLFDRGGKATTSLKEHTRGVQSLAYSPKGNQLVSSGTDGQVLVWDIQKQTSTLLRLKAGATTTHAGAACAVAWSHDGTTIASSGVDQKIHLWDATSLRYRKTLRGHKGPVCSLAFSPDGKWLASHGHSDGTVRLWSVASGTAFKSFPGVKRSGGANLHFSPDSRWLAYPTEASVILRETTRWTTVAELPDASSPTISLRFSPTGMLLATGHENGTIALWTYQAQRFRRAPYTLSSPYFVARIFFDKGGNELLGGTLYGIGVWGCACDHTPGHLVARSCYSGPIDAVERGQCKVGRQHCRESQWGPCQGEVLPGITGSCP